MRLIICQLAVILITINSIWGQKHPEFKGVTVILPPEAYQADPFEEISDLGFNWVCFVPFYYCDPTSFNISSWETFNWWGLSADGLQTSIRLAKKHGLKVLIKPQLYMDQSWPGAIHFNNEDEWLIWEKAYENFVIDMINIANKESAEMFCIGTELKK